MNDMLSLTKTGRNEFDISVPPESILYFRYYQHLRVARVAGVAGEARAMFPVGHNRIHPPPHPQATSWRS